MMNVESREWRIAGFGSVNCWLRWAIRCISIRRIGYVFVALHAKLFVTGDRIKLTSGGLFRLTGGELRNEWEAKQKKDRRWGEEA